MISFSNITSFPWMIQRLVLKRAVPVFVSWCLTEKCNYRCIHCAVHENPRPEIRTDKVLKIIKKLHAAGTRIISFSGGETLLRNDIKSILDLCRQIGITTRLTSNGALVSRKLDALSSVDVLKLSIDGSRETHEHMRGKGSFDDFQEAIASASRRNIKFVFNTAITKVNTEDIPFVLGLAARHDTIVTFQPLEKRFGLGEDKFRGLIPDISMYRRVISHLIREKMEGNRHIGNSISGLYQLWRWPMKNRIKCHAGKWFIHVNSEGKLMPCDRMDPVVDPLSSDSVESLLDFPVLPEQCDGCWKNNTLELNLALSADPNAIKNMVKWR